MKAIFFLLFLATFPAQAELYRWVDPQSGSVKFSNLPPLWHGDPAKEARAPKVEVIPFHGAVAPKPAAASALAPARVSGASTLPAPGPLEARWRAMQQQLAGLPLPQGEDFNRSGQGLQQQLKAYEAVSAELDRLDPAGAARRRTQETSVLERLRKGLEAQFRRSP